MDKKTLISKISQIEKGIVELRQYVEKPEAAQMSDEQECILKIMNLAENFFDVKRIATTARYLRQQETTVLRMIESSQIPYVYFQRTIGVKWRNETLNAAIETLKDADVLFPDKSAFYNGAVYLWGSMAELKLKNELKEA